MGKKVKVATMREAGIKSETINVATSEREGWISQQSWRRNVINNKLLWKEKGHS